MSLKRQAPTTAAVFECNVIKISANIPTSSATEAVYGTYVCGVRCVNADAVSDAYGWMRAEADVSLASNGYDALWLSAETITFSEF